MVEAVLVGGRVSHVWNQGRQSAMSASGACGDRASAGAVVYVVREAPQ